MLPVIGDEMAQKTKRVPKQNYGENVAASEETPSARTTRICDRLYGSMKDKIEAHGGTEGYMRWVRGADEDSEIDIWLRNKEQKS
jgi:hypothetical protein